MGDWKKCRTARPRAPRRARGDDVEAQMSDFTKSLGAMLAKNKKKPILWYDINKGYYQKGNRHVLAAGRIPRCIDKTKEQGIDLIVLPSGWPHPDEPRRTTCAPGPAAAPSC